MPRPLSAPIAPILLACLAVLAACTTPPPQNAFPEITFAHESPIRLDVREVSVELAYKAPLTPPNVEHLFPARPGQAATRWARDRLVAAGPMRRARYIVREASVVESSLEQSEGLTGMFTTEQSERYDARIVVEMQIIGEDGRIEGSLTAKAERSRSVPEDISLNERERVWFKMTEDLMKELNAQLEQTIKTTFFPFVIL
jgi:hypothetical protein